MVLYQYLVQASCSWSCINVWFRLVVHGLVSVFGSGLLFIVLYQCLVQACYSWSCINVWFRLVVHGLVSVFGSG